MKKVLSLAFIFAVFLLGCSADGFFNPETGKPTYWNNKVCKVEDQCNKELTQAQCEELGGTLILRAECPPENPPN